MISSQIHNLNSIKGKHQTNLDERLSTKWLAWNLPAVSRQREEDELTERGKGAGGVGRVVVASTAEGGVGAAADGDATRRKMDPQRKDLGAACATNKRLPFASLVF